MKKITKTFIVLLSVFGFLITTHAQESIPKINGGEYIFNAAKTPCLTLEQRENIKDFLKENEAVLKQENKLVFNEENKAGGHVLFDWPIQQATGFNYNETWAISGYVDHNATFPNQLLDYNCGSQTYDTASGYNHQGVDVYLWPFSWKQMDDSQTEIIAASAGQIIGKGDGQFDRSCGFNNNQWNAIYIQHSDGSVAWYGHMKSGSVTTKNIGDLVTTGEVLGTVGSSGNSTGPHLHFEVYTDASYSQLVDPYYGTCNNFNLDSWWLNQKPYSNPNINAALTHSDNPIVFPTCPTAETTYESNDFELGDTVYLTAFLRDQIAGTNLSAQILRPDNSIFYSTSFNTSTTSSSWYYYWSFNSFDVIGEWKWRITYQGQTVTHLFNIQTLSIAENELESVSIYPNPTKDYINISSSNSITKARLVDLQGKIIQTIHNVSEGIQKVSLEAVSNGTYFLTLESNSNQKKTFKIIKE
ncbi:peptidoglycan DD-metalloendopeptidase family protein [Lacinutrix sp. WUR7]|uniref:peptidoglycan DD-metalloendopeptidase family protein n=1 Tax=Lacinutrix sp. WUR7 TaxID=2653681 RepID=UPI00193E2F9E|nr:peptidoglycan DD-metalloendopeptidase family protein [Lacinutrix sp. WUR7]QRM88775.1 peptidoglycan DD-metalloendopeptidase family protein [Lacinutrix sp. WUR7]